MLHHEVEGVLARALAEARVERDVAAEQRLQPRADAADHRARAHDDATNDADAACNVIALELECGGDEGGVELGARHARSVSIVVRPELMPVGELPQTETVHF